MRAGREVVVDFEAIVDDRRRERSTTTDCDRTASAGGKGMR